MRKALRALAAIAMAVGVGGALSLTATGTALASTTFVGYICNAATQDCLVAGNPVIVKGEYSSTTNWNRISDGTWDGSPVYEYQQADTNNCLTYDEDGGDTVDMHTCDGIASEQWAWTVSSGNFVNLYATAVYGTNGCLDQPYAAGYDAFVDECAYSSAPLWYITD
jgi:hypothetical protein